MSSCKSLWSVALVGLACAAPGAARAESSADVLASFADPPREYSSAPFWVWNDLLTDEQIRQTLRDLAGQGIRQAIVHPRPGLVTPYLSEEWFRLWKVSLDEAAKLDMNLWIYDENSYPSGFAGGFVPEAMPESRGLGVELVQGRPADLKPEDVLAVYRVVDGAYENITEQAKSGQALPEGTYVTAKLRYADPGPWFGGKNYVDLLRPGVTAKFLEITLEPYRREIGEHFGKRVPGSFTDEPHLRPAGGLHWTPDLPQVFEQRWGYSLLDSLPSLTEEVGDWRRVRHNYYQTLLDLFVDRWAKPYYEYCAKNNLEFTGHYWEHSWPDTTSAPDNMAMYAWQQRPGIDILFNQGYQLDPHAQVGNTRAVLELGSAANQTGRTRTLCEAYGGSGWDVRFEDLKRIGDWIFVLGVNTMNEHLSHITLRGARKGDYPPTFSYHNPSFESYNALVSYFKRQALALSRGEQINEVLLLEPTSTVWMYQGNKEKREAIGTAFQELVEAMAHAQVEFDLGSEHTVAERGSVDGAGFVVGERRYTTVVIPPLTENLNAKTVDLLGQYLANGGQVLSLGESPLDRVDGQESPRAQELAKGQGWGVAGVEDGLERLAKAEGPVKVLRAGGDKGKLFHHRRQYDDGDVLFLVNSSDTERSAGTVSAAAAGVTQWDLEAGTTKPYAFRKGGQGVEASFDLPPAGSLMLFLSKAPVEAGPAEAAPRKALAPEGALTVRRDQPNVLKLDYVDITAGGETKQDLHFYRAAEMAFQKNGMDRNPWDHAVQFRDEYLSKTFPADSGFEMTYKFTIADTVPAELDFVVERADLYSISCNGQPVQPKPGAWWLDRAFARIDIGALAKAGENTVTLKASPFTVFHEIQPAYVIGDFSLKAAPKGFVIATETPLELGAWNAQGYPLYGHGVTYAQAFAVEKPEGRYVVELPKWYGSVARVRVNGKDAGHIYRQPFECDVTPQIRAGENTVEVTVIGTLKNTLGPHLENPPLGIAAPDMFRKGPEVGPPAGDQYSTIGYGLMEPFTLSAE